jgi:serine/threonine-protein kinase
VQRLISVSYEHHIVLDPDCLGALVAEHTDRDSYAGRDSDADVAAPTDVFVTASDASTNGATVLERRKPEVSAVEMATRATVAIEPRRQSSARRVAGFAVILVFAAAGAVALALAVDGTEPATSPSTGAASSPLEARERSERRGDPGAPPEIRALRTSNPQAPTLPTKTEASTHASAPRSGDGDEPRGRMETDRTRSRLDEPARPVDERHAILNIYTQPWADVYVDGEKLTRSAPLRGLEVPAGVHEIRLVNPVLERSAEQTVTVAPGEVRNVALELR